jgi:hypothetical protein
VRRPAGGQELLVEFTHTSSQDLVNAGELLYVCAAVAKNPYKPSVGKVEVGELLPLEAESRGSRA